MDELRREIESAIQSRVRSRFGLTSSAFAERVLELLGRKAGNEREELRRLNLDDLYLATACMAGEDRAWRELEARHFGFVRAFARRFDLEPEAAGEVAQEVLADLWGRRRIESYAGRSSLRTWLGAVVTNAALTARTRAGRIRRREEDACTSGEAASSGTSPETAWFEGAVGRAAAAALSALPAEERLLLLLHFEERLTLEEVGALQGRSKATMSRTLKRLCAGLHAEIERRLSAEHGVSLSEVRPQIDLSRVDLDMRALLAGLTAERAGTPPV